MSRHKADHRLAIPDLSRNRGSTGSGHFPVGLRIHPDRSQSGNGLLLNNGAIAKAVGTILLPVHPLQWGVLGPVSPGQGIVVLPVQPPHARAVARMKGFGCTDQATICHGSSLPLRSRAFRSAFCLRVWFTAITTVIRRLAFAPALGIMLRRQIV